MGAKYYAVAHHGTAGLAWSYGYAEVWKVEPGQRAPQGDQTTTVAGPFASEIEANAEADKMSAEAGLQMHPAGYRK